MMNRLTTIDGCRRRRRMILGTVMVFIVVFYWMFLANEPGIVTTEERRHPHQIDPSILAPLVQIPEDVDPGDPRICVTDVTKDHLQEIKQAIKTRVLWGKELFYGWLPADVSTRDNVKDVGGKIVGPRSALMWAYPFMDNPNVIHSSSSWWQTHRDWDNADQWSYFDYMGPVSRVCPVQSFAKGDDEKRMCWTPRLAASDGCVVFSIGSNNQWAFEEDIARRTNCQIHTFDCTLWYPRPPTSIRDRVTFHNLCLGSNDFTASNGQKYVDFTGLVRAAGKKPTFMKMDIEGYEYAVLMNVIAKGLAHERQTNEKILPDQITMEVHYRYLPFTHEMFGRREILSFFNHLWAVGGYLLADRNDNPLCYHCSEVLLIRAIC